MTAGPATAADIAALFAARNTHVAEVAIIQPADPFLDMAGEDLRRRIFLTESETGQSLCLRPEFTIPVCLDHIASQAGTPRRYSYLGEVFRQRRDGGNEFFQAGIEALGDRDIAAADARSVADAHALLQRVLPGRRLAVTLGDQAVFEAVLAALGLPRGWRMRLARAFGSEAMLEAALADLANPPRNGHLTGTVAALVADGEATALAAHIAQGMEQVGLSASAGRTPADIARRLIEKAELRSVRLSNEAFSALKAFLAIDVPLTDAAQALDQFAADAGDRILHRWISAKAHDGAISGIQQQPGQVAEQAINAGSDNQTLGRAGQRGGEDVLELVMSAVGVILDGSQRLANGRQGLWRGPE
jgi:ATP phosphoribosyltransferase regulatory subunit